MGSLRPPSRCRRVSCAGGCQKRYVTKARQPLDDAGGLLPARCVVGLSGSVLPDISLADHLAAYLRFLCDKPGEVDGREGGHRPPTPVTAASCSRRDAASLARTKARKSQIRPIGNSATDAIDLQPIRAPYPISKTRSGSSQRASGEQCAPALVEVRPRLMTADLRSPTLTDDEGKIYSPSKS